MGCRDDKFHVVPVYSRRDLKNRMRIAIGLPGAQRIVNVSESGQTPDVYNRFDRNDLPADGNFVFLAARQGDTPTR
jgi:hypothetical protein